MGISGLLQFIKDASESVNVKKYKGQTVAVDTYCWLHKGAFSCAEKLAKGEPTDQYVTYCMKFVDMLLTSGVKPILVFDGCNLPSKKEVDKARRERRQANLQKGRQLLREGKVSEARECFTRSVNVTPSMAHDVIKAARIRGVDCVVAPYEADAQLAYLNKSGIAQAVITEDSDLLAFGCKKVLLKMDKFGNGLEIDQSNFGKCKSLGDVFTEEKFRYMCILSGCDYLASIHGIGLGKACKLLKMANNPDIIKVIKKMGQYLKMNVTVSDDYIEGFLKANNTFLYQLVFDPISRKIVPLNPYPDDIDVKTLSYAGRNIGDQTGLQIALGNVDVNSLEKIDDYNPDTCQPVKPKPRSRGWNDAQDQKVSRRTSIWSRGYMPTGLLPSPNSVVQSPEKPSTRGVKVISTRSLKLPSRAVNIKREREESEISEEDLLGQYSPSSNKKVCREEGRPAAGGSRGGSSLPAARQGTRNRFATLLQRRNWEEGPAEEQEMRSRFFCSPDSVADPGAKQSDPVEPQESAAQEVTESSQPSETTVVPSSPDTEIQDEEVEMPAESPRSPFPCPTRRGTGAFVWSGGLVEKPRAQPSAGLSALQKFQRRKESVSWSTPTRATSAPPDTSPEEADRPGSEEDGPTDSPPSQDSAYFSQPSRSSRRDSTPPHARPGHIKDPELSSQESDSGESVTCSPVTDDKKPAGIRAKVSGLPRAGAGGGGLAGKIRPSAPARASGLSKKSSGGKKKVGGNDENKPGLQATISDLWKNFGFKRENERLHSGRKGDPMSPVKDNIQALTPETEQDVYNSPHCPAIQKAICC
ncbi:exonuclease 1 isoform X2 [Amia ocellicauda]|uniref:exonuclease 1 isoform X2 n=1 Tax=Amia ocellicauda TaxID=2972642 RepID=UPI003463EF1F